MMDAMQILTGAAAFVWAASLKTTVLAALVLLAQKLFGRLLSANGRYLLWLAVVISLVTPVGFDVPLPALPTDAFTGAGAPQRVPAMQSDVLPIDASRQDPAAFQPAGAITRMPRWDAILPLLWLAGMLATLSLMGLSNRKFTTLARNGEAPPEGLQSILRECELRAHCSTPTRLVQSSGLRAPVVIGLFRPVLLWPTGLETLLTPAQVRHVVMHEVTHVARRDMFGACVVAVLQALHWFNPAIWIAFSCLRHDREMACDAATIDSLHADDAADYARTLIELGALRPGTATPVPALGILGSQAQLRRRIHMLVRHRRSRRVQQLCAAVLLLSFATLAFSELTPAIRDEPAGPVPFAQEARMPAPEPLAVEVVAESSAPEPVPVPVVFAAAGPEARVVQPEPATSPAAPAAASAPRETQDNMLLAAATIAAAAPAPVPEPALPDVEDLAAAIDVAEDSSVVCRRFTSLEAGNWFACDSSSNWETFRQAWGIAPEGLPAVESVHAGENSSALQDEVCRNRPRVASMIKDRVCSSAAQWAAVDMVETGKCWPTGHSGSFLKMCFALSSAKTRATWNQFYMPMTMPSN